MQWICSGVELPVWRLLHRPDGLVQTAEIKIRGSRSLTGGNAPLYVIDGSPATADEFAMINSSDIESIEVLKDAASQAIYGTRAANGVILVSTKRGRSGKVRVNLNSYGSVQTAVAQLRFLRW